MNILLSLYFFLLPFQFALAPTTGVDLAVIRPVTLGIVVLWLIHGLQRKKIFVPPLLPLFLVSGFLFVTIGSGVWSENGLLALRKGLFLFSFFPICILLTAWFEEQPGSRERLLKAFVGGAFLAASSGILLFLAQFIFGVERVFAFLTQTLLPFFLGPAFAQAVAEHPSLLVNISGATILRASGVFPDPHMFAFYLGMAAPLALSFSLMALPSQRMLWRSMFVLILLADLLSFSRGAYAGLVIGGLVFLFTSGVLHRFRLRQKGRMLALSALCLVVLGTSPVGTRFLSSFSQNDGSNVERLRLWQEAFGHIAERPLFGVGLGNYATLVNPGASLRDPIYVHSLFLDIAVETGLLGLTFFIALLSLAMWGAYTRFRKERDWVALSLVTSLALFSAHSFFETPLFSVHVLPALLLLLAVGVSYSYDQTLP